MVVERRAIFFTESVRSLFVSDLLCDSRKIVRVQIFELFVERQKKHINKSFLWFCDN